MIIPSITYVISISLSRLLISYNVSNTLIILRVLIGFIIILIMNFQYNQKLIFSNQIFARSVLQLLAMAFTYYGYQVLSLSSAIVIGQTGAIFNTLIACLFKESKYNHKLLLRILIGYAGVMIISGYDHSNQNVYGITAILLANILSAFILIISKNMSKHHSLFAIEFSVSFIQSIFMLILLPFVYQHMSFSFYYIQITALISIFSLIGRFAQMYVIKHYDIASYAPYEYLNLVLAYLFDYILHNKVMTLTSIIGSFFVLLSSII